MNRVAMHVTVILVTALLIGLIVRNRQPAQPEVGQAQANPTPTNVSSEGWLSEFELTERSGKQISSDDLKGEPYVVSFFFTTCPSTCPMQNAKLKILQEEFRGQGVRFLSVSCDPEVDTPEVLAEYADRFEADPEQWLFLTGELDYIRRVGAEIFRLPVNKRFHTDRFVLVDGEGKITAFYEWPEPGQFEKLKEDLQAMLDSSEPTTASESEKAT